jgi:hypothetical protein
MKIDILYNVFFYEMHPFVCAMHVAEQLKLNPFCIRIFLNILNQTT